MLGAFAWASLAVADDWPTYQHDVARTGITAERLALPLVECWKFQSRYAPRPAWGDPKPNPVEGILELRRRHFDDVDQVVVADGAAYFGSSADHKLYCLDLASGKIRWTFITGGPIRLAPSIVKGRAYFGSDDGWIYCLKTEDGSVAWRFRAAPGDNRVLGHGKMISLWPVRTGVLVDAGTAYFGAGIFPAEGVFLYAADANDGKVLWRNDSCGEAPQSAVSPQGYLLASPTTVYAPMGRVSPGAFDRRDGKLKFQSFFGKNFGGTYAMLVDGGVYTGTEKLVGYRQDTQRDTFAVFEGRRLVVNGSRAYLATGSRLKALDRTTYPAAYSRCESLRTQIEAEARKSSDKNAAKVQKLKKELEAAEEALKATVPWDVPCSVSDAMVLAGEVLYVGGAGQIVAVDCNSGKSLWKTAVDGAAKGLAVAAGRLVASTDKGVISCFGPEGSPSAGTTNQPRDEHVFDNAAHGKIFTGAADAIVKQTGVRRGYCLVLGCKTGQLAVELAKRTELMIYAVSPDAATASAVRRAVDATGLYGARICVEHWPSDHLPYSDYFANLIVSESAIVGEALPARWIDESLRLLKPLGGVAFLEPWLGKSANTPQPKPASSAAIADAPWIERSTMLIDGAAQSAIRRGPLPGAGSWTHEYGNPGNTACSDDEMVRGPLGVLWFGDPGPARMASRHERAAGPLEIDGRLFIQGENVVMAYDAYNGVKLWDREIPGAMRVNASHDGSNLALSHERLLVAVGDQCLGIDPATGQTKNTYVPPAGNDRKKRRWGYVACAGNTLFGSQGVRPTVSERIFALDVESGKPRWVYEGKQIPHNTIALSDGRLLFIDGNATKSEREDLLASVPAEERAAADVRLVVALDVQTGQTVWKKPMNLGFCGGGNLAAMASRGKLVVFGVYLDGHYWKQFFAGSFADRRVAVLDATDGRLLWSKPVGYRVRPIIVGDTLHAEPWAFDLATGKDRTRVHPVTGETERWQFARPGHHCGCPNAAPHCLFFRSWCLGYYDLVADYGTMHFGAQRPGCWINFLPAGGLLLVPEASAGCMCPFPNMCTVAFKPAGAQKGWGYFSSPGPMTPVQRLAINLGAAGDRRDESGRLWLGYPRPTGSLVLQLKLDTAFVSGGAFEARSSFYTPISGAKDPWLFTSAARGLTRCAIPILGRGDGTAVYGVRLGFSDPDNDRPGVRLFDVKLQGKTVLSDFDVAAAAGGRDKAVFREFQGIEVADNLLVELVPKTSKPTPDRAPILQAVEIVREKVLKVGCVLPDYLLSTMEPKQSAAVQLANLRDTPFQGTAEVLAPEGLHLAADSKTTETAARLRVPVEVAARSRSSIPLEVSLARDLPAGKYPLKFRLLRSDGTEELATTATVEHLGRRARLVVKAAEDAYVQQRYPLLNKGSATVLTVDGGSARMNDLDHAVAYLRFRFTIPGRVLGVRLRIQCAGNPSSNAGRVRLVTAPWSESSVAYATRPACGQQLAILGTVAESQRVERTLKIDLTGKTELSLAIDPTTTDAADFHSRESGSPPELIIDYEPQS